MPDPNDSVKSDIFLLSEQEKKSFPARIIALEIFVAQILARIDSERGTINRLEERVITRHETLSAKMDLSSDKAQGKMDTHFESMEKRMRRVEWNAAMIFGGMGALQIALQLYNMLRKN